MWYVKTDDLNKAREIVGEGASLTDIFKEIPRESIITPSMSIKTSHVIEIMRMQPLVDSGEYTVIHLNVEG